MNLDIFTRAAVITDNAAQTSLSTGNWYTKNMSTVESDPQGIVLGFASSQITLAAGTYFAQGIFSFYQANQSRIRLFDVTANAAIAHSSSGFGQYLPVTPNPDIHNDFFVSVFTLSVETVVELQYRVGNASSSYLGVGNSWGTARCSYFMISKLAEENQIALVRGEKSNGVVGGHFTTGAFRTRDLSTVVYNSISGLSLATNQLTIPTGAYYVFAQYPTIYTASGHGGWYNVTDGTYDLIGGPCYSNATGPSGKPDNCSSVLSDILVVTGGPKVYEFQQWADTSSYTGWGGLGMGYPSSAGVNEIYAQALLIKVA